MRLDIWSSPAVAVIGQEAARADQQNHGQCRIIGMPMSENSSSPKAPSPASSACEITTFTG